jgi:hypothetical protein
LCKQYSIRVLLLILEIKVVQVISLMNDKTHI